jgi:periodic tryptophan protein 1
MISSLAWINQGAAASEPKKQLLNDEEYAEIMSKISNEIESAKKCVTTNETKDNQDKSSENSSLESGGEFTDSGDALFQDVNKLTMKDEIIGDGVEEEDEEDLDDLKIRPSDRLLVCGRNEDEVSYLDVYVYEEDGKNLFVHHDFMIPTFPLCVQPINTVLLEGEGRNFLAIGMFDTDIEVWNLDVIEASFPTLILKGQQKEENSPRKKGKKKNASPVVIDPDSGHSDAIMSLSWHPINSDLILSASADKTVKLWNLKTQKVERTFTHHKDKVQAVQWSPHEPTVFASAGYDKQLFITQISTGEVLLLDENLPSDPECLAWDQHHPGVIALSLENGDVRFYSISLESHFLFSISCHNYACTAISFNPFVPGLFLTAGTDKCLKIWTFSLEGTDIGAKCLIELKDTLGKIFAASFCGDNPWLIAAAGSKASMKVFNLMDFLTTKEFISTKLSQMVQ